MSVLVVAMPLKESLSAPKAAKAAQKGFRKAGIRSRSLCLADGGEGTVDAFLVDRRFSLKKVITVDALGRPCEATMAWNSSEKILVMEMSSAAGLWQIPSHLRNPLKANTFGLGALMKEALRLKARKIIVGLGGSATVDGGVGLASALGFEFLDGRGKAVGEGHLSPEELLRVRSIVPPPTHPLAGLEVVGLCDVTNPLCGELGAAKVFGPQKGATPSMVNRLEKALAHLQTLWAQSGLAKQLPPGAGAAGGLGGGLVAFCGAHLMPGAKTVAQALGLQDALLSSQVVIGLEGSLDGQTAMGKGLGFVAGECKKKGIPFIALAGKLGEGYQDLHRQGLTAAFAIQNGPMSLENSMAQTEFLIEHQCEQVGRCIRGIYPNPTC